jgi:hypothetical protein
MEVSRNNIKLNPLSDREPEHNFLVNLRSKTQIHAEKFNIKITVATPEPHHFGGAKAATLSSSGSSTPES